MVAIVLGRHLVLGPLGLKLGRVHGNIMLYVTYISLCHLDTERFAHTYGKPGIRPG